MGERLPYEEQLAQQWNDLPLPQENMAWADMKRRLDEDDDKPVAVWWRRGCGLWGLLLLLLLVVGWFILRPEKWFSNSKKENTVNEKTVPANQKDSDANTRGNNNDTNGNNPQTNSSNDPDTVNTPGNTATPGNNNTTGNNTSVPNNPNTTNVKPGDGNTVPVNDQTGTNRSNTNNPTTRNRNNPTNPNRSVTGSNNSDQSTNQTGGNRSRGQRRNQTNPPASGKTGQQPPANASGQLPGNPVSGNSKDPTTIPQPDSPAVVTPKVTAPDTAIVKSKPTVDSITKKDSAVKKPVAATDKDKDKKKTYFSAGIAVHQLVPVSGQKSSPYNSLGRKGTLLDYIPSAYLRFHKEEKWFIQAEFRYGAPQYAKSMLYNQQVVNDTGQVPRFTTITSSRVQKTYYHQLPFSFNYYIRPNWSIGAGVVWNKFNTAIVDREIVSRNNLLQTDTVIGKNIIQEKGDSATAFSKSYFQALFETQYQWKRFSFGARYSIGIDPYIRITLPNQAPREERNQALQIFIRYQLWRSKSK